MGVKLQNLRSEIDKDFGQQIERAKNAIVRTFAVVGERVVNHARSLSSMNVSGMSRREIPPHQPNYIDWTANLRSSIGYVVTVDGNIAVGSNFQAIGNGQEGSTQGKEFAAKLAGENNQGIALIVVAGERYAKYVSAKGYDVIDSAEILAQKLIPQMLTQLGLK